MADDAPLILDALDASGVGLRLRLFRRFDRFAHEIVLVHGDEEHIALRSIEGNDHDHWPASPPFQQVSLHLQERSRRAALLVGMAGKSHWSGSMEADAARRQITFDIACRISEPPSWLGSQYEREAAPRPELGAAAIKILSGAELQASDSDRIAVRALLAQPVKTVRWRYSVAWSVDDGNA